MKRLHSGDILFGCLVFVTAVVMLIVPHLNQRMISCAATVAQSNKPVVVLDAGHGGFDGGAQGNGISEKEINLAITRKEALLCKLFGFGVVMTRQDDNAIHDEDAANKKRSDMHKRLAIMLENTSSITVSIHLNKFEQASAKGAQIFYSPKSSGSDMLAQTMQDSFKQLLQPNNHRQIKKADRDLFLLYNNDITPAVLVECGFISNHDEAEMLRTDYYQDQVAMTICYSLMKYQNRGEVTDNATQN